MSNNQEPLDLVRQPTKAQETLASVCRCAEVQFSQIRTGPSGLDGEALRDFTGQISGGAVFENDSFPVAEFADQINKWMTNPPEHSMDFVFDSTFFENMGELGVQLEGAL
ncbi:hypothetical protein [Streptomyces sp. NPDC005438]|uniref:DUF7878 domain-containing protein n=1 Tax=Streptomyces sp. NPDC005438 TaxID=3156880 RepID=UPI0033AD35EF